jgi:bifunctional N-acetylglucosamine-1-phosphate-uridyltransferase/glucosamine-1-phosphate-acetyltransferase GlmU-like protein
MEVRMSGVVLAGGKGERLQGIAAPYHKPLIILNGESLVSRAVRQALDVGCKDVLVITAPENTLPISQVLAEYGDQVRILVQRKADGPGDAVMLASQVVFGSHMLILMGDNYTPNEDVVSVVEESFELQPDDQYHNVWVVGTEMKSGKEAERFTYRTSAVNNTWVEKNSDGELKETDMVECWLGPLFVSCASFRIAMHLFTSHNPEVEDSGELPIGPIFTYADAQNFLTCTTRTIDVGTVGWETTEGAM